MNKEMTTLAALLSSVPGLQCAAGGRSGQPAARYHRHATGEDVAGANFRAQ